MAPPVAPLICVWEESLQAVAPGTRSVTSSQDLLGMKDRVGSSTTMHPSSINWLHGGRQVAQLL